MTSNKQKKQGEIPEEEMESLANIMKEAQLKEQENAANASQDELNKLKSDYEKSLEEIAQLKDQLVRNIADGDNLRKRTAKQVDDAGKFAINKFAKDLIEVLENLYLVTDNVPEDVLGNNDAFAAVFQGVEMTKTTLINVFDKYGVKRITPKPGEDFDHNLHEAVTQVEQNEFAPNTIVSVMRSGYTLNDRLLKPAMVVVAKMVQSVK